MTTLNDDGPSNTKKRKIAKKRKKRKNQVYDGEFWSLDGDDEMDPYSDLDLIVKYRSTTTKKDGNDSDREFYDYDDDDNVEPTTKTHGTYNVHRSRLGRQSGFFDRLLRGGFAESDNDDGRRSIEIFLHPLAVRHFYWVLDYIYYGKMEGLDEYVADEEHAETNIAVANISDYLEILPLYDTAYDNVMSVFKSSPCQYDNWVDIYERRFLFAQDLGMEKIAAEIVERYIESEKEGASFDDRCPSVRFMETCLAYYDNNPHVDKRCFAETLTVFVALSKASDVPKTIYDRFLEQSCHLDLKTFARFWENDRLPMIDILILREKFYPSSNVTEPLTAVEDACVAYIMTDLRDAYYCREEKEELLKDLPKWILFRMAMNHHEFS